MIRKRGDKWVLLTKDGKRILGTHDSYKAALKQERKILQEKHQK